MPRKDVTSGTLVCPARPEDVSAVEGEPHRPHENELEDERQSRKACDVPGQTVARLGSEPAGPQEDERAAEPEIRDANQRTAEDALQDERDSAERRVAVIRRLECNQREEHPDSRDKEDGQERLLAGVGRLTRVVGEAGECLRRRREHEPQPGPRLAFE